MVVFNKTEFPIGNNRNVELNMKISTRSRYGLRLLMELAGHEGDTPVFLSEIARMQGVSEKYLSKLVIPLRQAGLIKSVRGAHGGYRLGIDPQDISLLQIIECLEGSLNLVICVDNPEVCAKAGTCASRVAWGGLESVMESYCRETSLAAIVATSAGKPC